MVQTFSIKFWVMYKFEELPLHIIIYPNFILTFCSFFETKFLETKTKRGVDVKGFLTNQDHLIFKFLSIFSEDIQT